MFIFKQILDKLKRQLSAMASGGVKYYAPMDIAVSPIEISFIHLELLAELEGFYEN